MRVYISVDLVYIQKLKDIDKLFFQYEKSKILSKSPEYFYNGIFALKCGNMATKKHRK